MVVKFSSRAKRIVLINAVCGVFLCARDLIRLCRLRELFCCCYRQRCEISLAFFSVFGLRMIYAAQFVDTGLMVAYRLCSLRCKFAFALRVDSEE